MKINIQVVNLSLSYTLIVLPPMLYGISSVTYTAEGKLSGSEMVNVERTVTLTSTFIRLTNSWSLKQTNLPIPIRTDYGLSYDNDNRCVIIFGGVNGTDVLADTWIYYLNTGEWIELNLPVRPPGRYGHGFVYLSNGKSILLGGLDSNLNHFTDLWIFDTVQQQWVKQNFKSTESPLPRVYAAVNKLNNSQMFLFGGYNGISYLNDTWIYDINTTMWEKINTSIAPLPRRAALSAHHPGSEHILLYGGFAGGYYNDTWYYTHSTREWIQKNPVDPPLNRAYGSLVFDTNNYRYILYGGTDDRKAFSDTYIYNLTQDKWISPNPVTKPTARAGHYMIYDETKQNTILFFGTTNYADLWQYTIRRTGEFISPIYAAAGKTEVEWLTFSMLPISQSSNLSLQFLIASSTDTINWTEFTGYNGEPDKYYIYAGVPARIWDGHYNRRYLQFKAVLSTLEIPYSPTINQITVSFNRAPEKVVPNLPYSNQTTNQRRPEFRWQPAIDDDNDSLFYQLQISPNITFMPVTVELNNISINEPVPSLQITTSLTEGYWYYRFRANDGRLNGLWSDTLKFRVDLQSPAAITYLATELGPSNGSIHLTWTAPGNDGTFGVLLNGKYRIKFSSITEINNNTNWQETKNEIVLDNINTYYGKNESYTVTGLSDGTSYYFTVKTVDNAENESGLSTVSVAGYTNSAPQVNLIYPRNTIILRGKETIRWEFSDTNLGDKVSFDLFLSTNYGLSYDIPLTLNFTGIEKMYDTRQIVNGEGNLIKIFVRDERGLIGVDTSAVPFTISNPNEPPELKINLPSTGQVIDGNATLNWSVTDVNEMDKHQFNVYLSPDNGLTWTFVLTPVAVKTTYYILDTKPFTNLRTYAVKVEVNDNGSPVLSTFTVVDNLTISNDNKPPSEFNLLTPIDHSSQNVIGLVFRWTSANDPNPEDTITYTLEYSTSVQFTGDISSFTGINQPEFNPVNSLPEYVQLFWRVKATDNLGSTTLSRPSYLTFFTLSRTHMFSPDNLVEVKVEPHLPPGVRLQIIKDKLSQPDVIPAQSDTTYDSLTRKVTDDVYQITFITSENKPIEIPNPISITINYKYPDENNDGWLDNYPTEMEVANLRVCWFDQENSKWINFDPTQRVWKNRQTISTQTNRAGFYSLRGYAQPDSILSGVTSFPNPFNPVKENTKIRYILTQDAEIKIRIYSTIGDLVKTITRQPGEEGSQGLLTGKENVILWDGNTDRHTLVSNGTYLCSITAIAGTLNKTLTRLITVVK